MTARVDLRAGDLAIVQAVLAAGLPQAAMVWAFGSRARGLARRSSDLDLVVDAGRVLTPGELATLDCGFEESDLPFVVDVLDWMRLSEEFRRAIEQDRVLLRGQPAS